MASGIRSWTADDFRAEYLPLRLDGVRLIVNGRPAPIAHIGPRQWNVLAPLSGATVRARATCIDGGVGRTGETGLVNVVPDQGNAFDANITLGTTTPIANTLSLTAPLTRLNAPNATRRLTVTAASTGTGTR
ncbi:MAG: hypothetical protein ACKV22_07660 [Bryobacteraceae bacterium]